MAGAKATSRSVDFWDSPYGYEQFTPVEQWSAWDTATIDGDIVPGVVRIRSRKTRRIVKSLGVGAQREQISDTGIEGAPIDIVCRLWMPAHLQQYAKMADKIELLTGPRGDPRAVPVSHPGLALLKVRYLYIISVGIPEPHGDGGTSFSATIQAQEAKPKKKDDKDGKAYAIDPTAKPPRNAIEDRMNGAPPSKTDAAP